MYRTDIWEILVREPRPVDFSTDVWLDIRDSYKKVTVNLRDLTHTVEAIVRSVHLKNGHGRVVKLYLGSKILDIVGFDLNELIYAYTMPRPVYGVQVVLAPRLGTYYAVLEGED